MAPYNVIVTALATYYVTYVITRSEFPPVLRVRDWIFDRVYSLKVDVPNEPVKHAWVAYLVTCGFCTAFYVAAAVVGITSIFTEVPLPVLLWLASAAISGVLTELTDALRASVARSTK